MVSISTLTLAQFWTQFVSETTHSPTALRKLQTLTWISLCLLWWKAVSLIITGLRSLSLPAWHPETIIMLQGLYYEDSWRLHLEKLEKNNFWGFNLILERRNRFPVTLSLSGRPVDWLIEWQLANFPDINNQYDVCLASRQPVKSVLLQYSSASLCFRQTQFLTI